CQMGMSEQRKEPEVVMGYEQCGHTDVSQRSPFIEEKGNAEPKEAELSFYSCVHTQSSPSSLTLPSHCPYIDDFTVQPGPPPATGTTQTELRGPEDSGGEAPHAAVSNKHIVSAGCAVRVQRVTMSQQRVCWLQ
ncbi:hypothetical protein L3Q82_017784, partial [Scortum barcoo]